MMDVRIKYKPPLTTKKGQSKLKEIANGICAILNNGYEGGRLILENETGLLTAKDHDDTTRTIEQCVENSFPMENLNDVLHKRKYGFDNSDREIHFDVKAITGLLPKLWIVKYNVCQTNNSEVKIRHFSNEQFLKFLEDMEQRKTNSILGMHERNFSYNCPVNLEESKEIQLKMPEKVENIVKDCNKLTHYISAFANGNGGSIYYGIKMNEDSKKYTVYGVNVEHNEKKNEIIKNVTKAIDCMFVWPVFQPGQGKEEKAGSLVRGEDWEIYFEKVLNVEPKNLKFVIVISVNPLNRAVLMKKPESYRFDADEKVREMEIEEIKERLLMTNYRHIFFLEEISVPLQVGRAKWSSYEQFKIHVTVLEKLVSYRNNGLDEKFCEYKKELRDSGDFMKMCLAQQQDAADCFRKGKLKEAAEKLKENENFIKNKLQTPRKSNEKCQESNKKHQESNEKQQESNEKHQESNEKHPKSNAAIYLVRYLYWKSVVMRAQGNYEESETEAIKALQDAKDLPVILVIPWLHFNIGKINEANIVRKPNEIENIKKKLIKSYEDALRSAIYLSDYPEKLIFGLKCRTIISMARVYLGLFFDGSQVFYKPCMKEDVYKAKELLKVLKDPEFSKHSNLTKVTKAEMLVVECELLLRIWLQKRKGNYLQNTSEKAEEALKIAKENKFEDVKKLAIYSTGKCEKLMQEEETLNRVF
ncbi:uncharacterized protein LOC124442848 [Xenia sp. Carnegie-2017]|uniref:uncharacterized protein LOC124442848 n=1 Tax=Xenia sp. Carnegie-2017 TaxID=2897299 RepID=UPI001F04BB4D|nr:uncharacterized protein LOC124442848 [Xenia sp. Carnegie-2017]